MSDFVKKISESGTDGLSKSKIYPLLSQKRKNSTLLEKNTNKIGIGNSFMLITLCICQLILRTIKKAKEENINQLFSTNSVVHKLTNFVTDIKNSQCQVSKTVVFPNKKNKILNLHLMMSTFYRNNLPKRIHQWMPSWISWKVHH